MKYKHKGRLQVCILQTTMVFFLTDLFNNLVDKQHEVSTNWPRHPYELTKPIKHYRLVATLAGHSGPINAFSFNLNGSLLASGGDDEEVQIWDLNVFRQFQTLADHSGTWGQITCIKFLKSNGDLGPSGDLLCFGTGRGYLLLYHRQRRTVRTQNISPSAGY